MERGELCLCFPFQIKVCPLRLKEGQGKGRGGDMKESTKSFHSSREDF